jgi:uncharacterized membrane protein
MFLRKQIDDVGFSAEEVGLAFVHANDCQQRQILLSMAAGAEAMDLWHGAGSWAMQCRGIVDGSKFEEGLSANERSRIAAMLDVLVDHLREPVKDVL